MTSPQIRVHKDDQEILAAELGRYTKIISILGSALISAGVPEAAIKELIDNA